MDDNQSTTNQWKWFGLKYPKQEVVFFSQIFILYIVIVASIVNLSISNDNTNLWITLLSSSIGYMLPNPSIKNHGTLLRDTAQQ